jgi:thymidylate synthase
VGQTIWIKRSEKGVIIHGQYADDFLHFVSNKDLYVEFRNQFQKRFDLKSGPADIYLGNNITSNLRQQKVHIDQLAYVENLLRNDPFSRRIMMSYWNPVDFDKTALVPCHVTCQFYVTEKSGERYLSCHFMMRSNDMFLGNPFNIFSYAVLTYILAIRCNMKPDRLVYSVGDAHIYKNHLQQVAEQLSRPLRPLPKLKVNQEIRNKRIENITIDDFDIIGYHPHSSISASMAV